MLYAHILVGIFVGIHAFTYGRWLKNNGNRAGGNIVYFIVLIAIALPIYRLATAP
ncbi:MAG: hypothetical protein H6Q67_1780 [Firmicutes bacterium]|nr:hypothetical protein [Bacillota bacterium]